MPKKSGSGKKKKGPKRTKSQLEQEKIDKAADEFEQAKQLHADFIERIDKWLLKNYARAIDLFRRFDSDGDGWLSYEEFYAGMRDLRAPCNALELHVLARAVDEDHNGKIDYREFSTGVRYYRPEEVVPDDGLPVLKIRREELEKCQHCAVGIWNPSDELYPRFICLEVRLVTFAKMTNYPGHFRVYVHSQIKVQGVINMINERHGNTLRYIKIFHEEKDGKGKVLDPSLALFECGFVGGPRNEPQFVELLYDFATEFDDCPVLMSDHYFTYEKPTRGAYLVAGSN